MARELLFSVTRKDFRIDTFASGGPGGQHQNKTASGVRIVHPDSGAVGESREHRSQHMNKEAAFHRLVNSGAFRMWHAAKVREILSGRTVAQRVEEAMDPANLLVEVRGEDGKWQELPSAAPSSEEKP